MWCWRRMEKISWTDHVRNEEVLLRVDILYEIRKRKANWIGHILRRNWLLKQVIEGKIKGDMEWQEDVRSYWMTLRTGEDTLIWRRRLWIALCGGIVLEEALDLSSDRILNEWMNKTTCFGHPLCPSSGVLYSTFGTGKFHVGFWWLFPSRVRMEHPGSAWKQSSKTYMKLTSAECRVENSWWWAEGMPETCRVL